ERGGDLGERRPGRGVPGHLVETTLDDAADQRQPGAEETTGRRSVSGGEDRRRVIEVAARELENDEAHEVAELLVEELLELERAPGHQADEQQDGRVQHEPERRLAVEGWSQPLLEEPRLDAVHEPVPRDRRQRVVEDGEADERVADRRQHEEEPEPRYPPSTA